MTTIEAIIERDGDGYTVLTRRDGSNPWGVGVTFPSWSGARSVAVAILNATHWGDNRPEQKLTDTTEEKA
jgi:hypothetical protein